MVVVVVVVVGSRDEGMQAAPRKREPQRTRTSAEAHGYLWSLVAWINTLVSSFQQVDPENSCQNQNARIRVVHRLDLLFWTPSLSTIAAN